MHCTRFSAEAAFNFCTVGRHEAATHFQHSKTQATFTIVKLASFFRRRSSTQPGTRAARLLQEFRRFAPLC